MLLELPMCPSGNRYWRVFHGRAVKSPEARAYIARIKHLYRPAMLLGRVAVRLDLHLCRGDVDNRAKVALDALKGIAYRDDRQVRSLQLEGFSATAKTERLLVRVTPWVSVRAMDDIASRAMGELHARHTDECLAGLADPGETCVCRPPAVAEPLVGRVTPNAQRPR